jgi:glycosyltransferase involved in cell wall biosynthesis
MKSVSIVMATYNGGSYIAAQLESIRRQTLTPHEMIVSDDGSSDDTLRIVSAFAERVDFPVRVHLNTKRLGYAENFLTAAKHAEGAYVAFCDQDDEWHPQKLERCVTALETEDALLCAHTATLIDSASNYIGYFPQGIVHGEVLSPLALPPWEVFFGFTQVFRRDLLDLISTDLRGIDSHTLQTDLAHDRWIYFLALSLGKTVTLACPLAAYRQHGNNAFGGLKKNILKRLHGKFNGSAHILRQYMLIALHRARLMSDLASQRGPSPLADQALMAAAYWKSIAETYALRTRLYDTPQLAQRLVMLRQILDLGIYRPRDEGGLGLTVLAKDVVLGLLRLPLSPSRQSDTIAVEQPVGVEDNP